MRGSTMRLGLSLMVVLSLWTTRLPAQDVFVVPATPYEPARHPEELPALSVKLPPPPAKHLYLRALNHVDLGCKADDWGTTGNYWSETRWIFGSSRSFFREACVPNQPCVERRMQMKQMVQP